MSNLVNGIKCFNDILTDNKKRLEPREIFRGMLGIQFDRKYKESGKELQSDYYTS